MADKDRHSVELGVRITTTVAGRITAVRFFKTRANAGQHVGSVWSSSGKLLARATFSNDHREGWTTVALAKPVTVAANTTFVASYSAPVGRYSVTPGAFRSQATSGNTYLRATAGLYTYGGRASLPTTSWNSSAYLVDVSFQPSSTPASPAKAGPVKGAPATPAPARPAPVTPAPVKPVEAPRTSTSSQSGSATRSSSTAPPAGAVQCLQAPSACGFPDATNTGVPAGTTLRASGSLYLSTPGETVSGLDVNGCISIRASNVTVRNTRVRGDCGGSPMISIAYSGVSNVLIDHVEVDGGKRNPSSPGITGAGYSVIAANIHGTGDGIDTQDNDHVADSYIHDLHVAPGDHTDGLQSAGGTNSTAVHNTIDASCASCNSAMIIGADLGPIGTFSADRNLLTGGGFTLFAGTGGWDSGVISFTGNRLGAHSFGNCSFLPSSGRRIAFSGNVLDATGGAAAC